MKTEKQLLTGAVLLISILITGLSCKKDDNASPAKPPVTVPAVSTPVGISKGQAVTKQIGAAGGTITSADQQLTITIPAGALSANTTIGIEPITNTNIAGMGTAFRLTPHGQHFDKPVDITYSWAAHADSIGLLQTLGFAYQKEDGSWKFVGANEVNKDNKTVTFKSTHFSDWSLMNQISLAPYRADLQPGESVTISALLFTDVDADDLIVPIPANGGPGIYDEPGYPVGYPIPLPNEFVKQWQVNGPGSIDTKAPTVVEYHAPASVNGYATAAVSLELKAPSQNAGQYLLVSNINIVGGSYVEMSVGGGASFTFPATPVVKSGGRYMLANPQNEGGGYFLLTWTGETGDHPFDPLNTGTYMHWQTDQTTYLSQYRPSIYAGIVPSGGSVNVTSLSNGWADGTFNATNCGYTETLVPTVTMKGKFHVKLAR